MSKEVKAALIGGICVIIGAIAGAYFGSYFENKKYTETSESNYINYENLQKDYENLLTKFEAIEQDYNRLSLQKNIYPSDSEIDDSISEADQLEIDEIIKRINDFRERHDSRKKDEFTYFEIDSYEIELMYKLFLSEEYYKYENIILAFEQYGVNCKELSINESLLELWDIEILYMYYNIVDNAEDNEYKGYYFNDYKMDKIDTFDYEDHGMNYVNDSYEFIYQDMKERIHKIIRKMRRNSLPLIRYE